jgi:hypothetical protein
VAFSPQATASCRRSLCQLLRIEAVAWSAKRIPTAVNLGFLVRKKSTLFYRKLDVHCNVCSISLLAHISPYLHVLRLYGQRTRDPSGSMATRLGAGVLFQARADSFIYSVPTSCGAHPVYLRVSVAASVGVKQQGREADH